MATPTPGARPVAVFQAPEAEYWNCNPYAVTFSPDGRWLVFGSGGFYGGGAITIVDLQTSKRADHRQPKLGDAGVPSISGVCFDASASRLALSAWSTSHRYAGVFVASVDGLALGRPMRIGRERMDRFEGMPTAVAGYPGGLVVRHNTRSLAEVLRAYSVPDWDPAPHPSRTHRRIASVGRRMFTGGGGSLQIGGWSGRGARFEHHRAGGGLVVGPDLPHMVDAPTERVTAIVAVSDDTLITGGLGGELDVWPVGDETEPLAPSMRIEHRRADSQPCAGAWATYRQASITGLCALEDGRWFAVDAGGEVSAWRGDARLARWRILKPGTPRAMAVHPDTPLGPLVAVAVKAAEGERCGYVVCYRPEPSAADAPSNASSSAV